VKLYRVMKVGADGKPLIGKRRNMLGVRPTDPASTDPNRKPDVRAVSDQDIVSVTEGLSTSPTTEKLLPNPKEAIFVIETKELPPELRDYRDTSTHYLIVPSDRNGIPLAGFQQALADTIDLWEPIEEGSEP